VGISVNLQRVRLSSRNLHEISPKLQEDLSVFRSDLEERVVVTRLGTCGVGVEVIFFEFCVFPGSRAEHLGGQIGGRLDDF